jgi:hypothetical protein
MWSNSSEEERRGRMRVYRCLGVGTGDGVGLAAAALVGEDVGRVVVP